MRSSGADPDAAMKQSGQTPLMMCAMSLSLPKARLILENGGSVDARDSAGNDLVWYAQFYKGDNRSQEMVQLLIEAGYKTSAIKSALIHRTCLLALV
jgi:hypothetical protein